MWVSALHKKVRWSDSDLSKRVPRNKHFRTKNSKKLKQYGKVGNSNKTTRLWHLSLEQKVFQELLGESPLFPTLTNHFF